MIMIMSSISSDGRTKDRPDGTVEMSRVKDARVPGAEMNKK